MSPCSVLSDLIGIFGAWLCYVLLSSGFPAICFLGYEIYDPLILAEGQIIWDILKQFTTNVILLEL